MLDLNEKGRFGCLGSLAELAGWGASVGSSVEEFEEHDGWDSDVGIAGESSREGEHRKEGRRRGDGLDMSRGLDGV